MDNQKYEFQGLLCKDKDGGISGAMSPVMAAKNIAKEMKIPLNGLIRVQNNQAYSYTYDHLIIKSNTIKGSAIISMFIDMGVSLILAAIQNSDGSIIITPIYKKQLLERDSHLDNLEAPKRCKDNPILELDEDGFKELFKQAIDSNKFKIKEDI